MDRLQKLQLEQSEKRSALGALLDSETPDADAIGKVSVELRNAEGMIQAAILAGGDEKLEKRTGDSSEGRELRSLLSKASIVDFAIEANGGAPLSGASLELRQELLENGGPGWMPIEMLEKRADVVTNITTSIENNQMPIAGRIFGQSAAEYLGVQSPSVPVGTTSYPRLSAGTTGDVRSPGIELDGAAATLTNEEIEPVRLTASYSFSVESLFKCGGL